MRERLALRRQGARARRPAAEAHGLPLRAARGGGRAHGCQRHVGGLRLPPRHGQERGQPALRRALRRGHGPGLVPPRDARAPPSPQQRGPDEEPRVHRAGRHEAEGDGLHVPTQPHHEGRHQGSLDDPAEQRAGCRRARHLRHRHAPGRRGGLLQRRAQQRLHRRVAQGAEGQRGDQGGRRRRSAHRRRCPHGRPRPGPPHSRAS
mmetsp:Transcript_32107/g.87027  ORF Transcript_32107/g.87027 Transcript_32107/m.87027 type:complete len:205 (-) Transcript_32107:1168-1782(-)